MLALVCLVLVGLLFGLVVVPFFRHRLATHVVALTPGNLDDWTVPPMLFVEEDLQPLSQISGLNWHDLRGVLDSRMLDALPARLQAAIPQNADVLIVYATAQGISREGQACLLCTDVDPSGSNDAAGQRRSVYPVRELLQRLAELDVPLKLLILDFGNLVSDPRMGMVINEFPRLLAQAMAEQADDRLWVLASHSVGEVAYAPAQQRQSVFGHSVAAGLAGAADADESAARDRFVTLSELYRHVVAACRAATGGRQTPLLLRGGADPSTRRARAQQLRLVAVRKPKVEPSREAAAEPAVNPPAASPPAVTPSSAAGSETAPAAAAPMSESPAPAPEPSVRAPDSAPAASPAAAPDPATPTPAPGAQGGR